MWTDRSPDSTHDFFTAAGEPRASSKAEFLLLQGQKVLHPSGCINRKLLQMHLPGPQDGGLERFPVFKKLKSKSAVIFLKYILLNKTSTLDASSKLRNMFKMTWLIIRRLFQDVSNPIFLVKEFKLSNVMYGLIRSGTWTEAIYLRLHFWQMNINYWENGKGAISRG